MVFRGGRRPQEQESDTEAAEEEWARRQTHRESGYNATIRSRNKAQVTLGRVQTFHYRSIPKTKQASCWLGSGVEIQRVARQTHVSWFEVHANSLGPRSSLPLGPPFQRVPTPWTGGCRSARGSRLPSVGGAIRRTECQTLPPRFISNDSEPLVLSLRRSHPAATNGDSHPAPQASQPWHSLAADHTLLGPSEIPAIMQFVLYCFNLRVHEWVSFSDTENDFLHQLRV